MFAELALSNYCSVQMFLHRDVEKMANWNSKMEKCLFHEDDTSCKLPEFPVEPKSRVSVSSGCSFETFRYTTIALSRVSGCYMILNYQRPA